MDFHGFLWFFIDLMGSGARVFGGLWQPVAACATLCRRTGSPIYQDFRFWRSGSGGLVPGCLDAEGLEWIGGGDGGDGGDGILGRGDWKKFSHTQASGARRICFCE